MIVNSGQITFICGLEKINDCGIGKGNATGKMKNNANLNVRVAFSAADVKMKSRRLALSLA